ncbi:hypothetical protein ONZ45_g19493 [Pleurotus djamor]|nr:hypothetical protein ONZ45_g19493 [Pleurotus djamor]
MTGLDWLEELINDHPRRIHTELGMHLHVYIALVAKLREIGLEDAREVLLEEQVAIFLYIWAIAFPSAEMIATAVAVGTDGRVILSPGATFALMVGIIITHGICCSASTKVIARLISYYAIMYVGATIAAIIALLVASGDKKASTADAFTLFENNTGWQSGSKIGSHKINIDRRRNRWLGVLAVLHSTNVVPHRM